MAKLLEPDPSTRMVRITSGFNDVLYSAANEPSLGMYRIQEHIALTVPRLVEQQKQLVENFQRVEGACYDLEYDTRTLKDMAGITQFRGIKHSLLQAIQLKKKLDEFETRKRTAQSFRPAASLSPTHSPPPPLTPPHSSLPPTLTVQAPALNHMIPVSPQTLYIPPAQTGDEQPVADFKPKTFD